MGVSKVEINTPEGKNTLIDLTNDSVTPETLARGVTAHDASGEPITGTVMVAELVQTTGNSETAVMSQKAVTEKMDAISEQIDNYSNVSYGTCSTVAGTSEKVVTVDNENWELKVGAVVMVKFTTSNSASNVKLNVNGTGAYPIWYNNAEYTSTGTAYTGYENRVIGYMFDGAHWVWIMQSYDSNTTYTNVKLGHGYATCATAEATKAKIGTLSSYTLTVGGIVAVKFTYGVPASATLNINSKGAKAIYYRGASIVTNVIKAGDIATFIYNGSQYHLLSIDRWQNDIANLAKEMDNLKIEIPVKGVHYWTEADQEEIVQQVITALGTPIFGRVDADKNITLTGVLVNGTYKFWFEDENGKVSEIGTYNHTVIPEPTWTNVIPLSINTDGTQFVGTNGEDGYGTGYRLKSNGEEEAKDGVERTGYIPASVLDMFYVYNMDMTKDTNGYNKIGFYDANFTYLTQVSAGGLYEKKDVAQIASEGVSFSDDGNLVSFTPLAVRYWAGKTTMEKTAYIRIYSNNITNESVITRNEQKV